MTSTRSSNSRPNPQAPHTSLVALAACRISRPAVFEGGVEIVVAPPAVRGFPTRVSEGLGVNLKIGAAHDVTSDGRPLIYPADAVCVRSPGCVWSSDVTTAGFVAIDIAPVLLPQGVAYAPMKFLPRSDLPDLPTLAGRLDQNEDPLRQQETLVELVEALFARDVLDAEELRAGADRRRAVDRARDFLASCWDAHPTLDELAGAVGANKFVLLRSFRRELGTTPHSYLNRLRIERARTMLAQGVAPREVAAASGFADQAHLNRHFKRIVGLPPGEYAQRVRAVIPVSAPL
ncbi:MAG: helix-turn-helix transcriptional regulator [Dehalococcoidia bacterium]